MLKQQTKLRVRLYARLSKDDGDADKESNSITNQLQMLRYNAKEANMWTMVILELPSTGRI